MHKPHNKITKFEPCLLYCNKGNHLNGIKFTVIGAERFQEL